MNGKPRLRDYKERLIFIQIIILITIAIKKTCRAGEPARRRQKTEAEVKTDRGVVALTCFLQIAATSRFFLAAILYFPNSIRKNT